MSRREEQREGDRGDCGGYAPRKKCCRDNGGNRNGIAPLSDLGAHSSPAARVTQSPVRLRI